jgi:hypothetical protein
MAIDNGFDTSGLDEFQKGCLNLYRISSLKKLINL